MPPTAAAYGTWRSPITASSVARARREVSAVALDASRRIWWSESRPGEGGGQMVLRREYNGDVTEVLPPGWDARSRVHEYGGGSWLPTPAGVLIFSHGPDQRLYRSDGPGAAPVPLTAEPGERGSVRYADPCLLPSGDALVCVREQHTGRAIRRGLVRVPLDGSGRVTEVWSGSDFLSSPRVSPDGTRLAWLCWDHPRMPWDGTELRIARLDGTGPVDGMVDGPVVAGGATESLLTPTWGPDGHLYVASDRSGWWNLYRLGPDGSAPEALAPMAEECGGPQWQFGAAAFVVLPDAVAFVHGADDQKLSVLDLGSGRLRTLALPYTAWGPSLAGSGALLVGVAAGPAEPAALVTVDVHTGEVQQVRRTAEPPDPAYVPPPRPHRVPTASGRAVPVTLYPPTNPGYTGPRDAPPPFVVTAHGGPTGRHRAVYRPAVAYLTSRGIGVAEVDYAGSTGYGRAYRELLTGEWGVLDVADCVAVAGWLVATGCAAPGRLAVRGSSAGGFTALACLADSSVFAAGVSLYGVADLERLAAETHDFESRYIGRLVGTGPDGAPRFRERSPLYRVDRIRSPVLLLQGADDPVVPPAQVHALTSALSPDVPYACLLFAGESHGFRREETIVAATEAELSFYGQVFGFDPPDVPVLPLTRNTTLSSASAKPSSR
jgi:dipeptidyl aminopeptidase/acylaminoacyl peptidase